MTAIYRRTLGPEFDKLHPRLQRRFGFSSADDIACIGTGVMETIWRGPFYTTPFLMLGTWRNIMFPATGAQVPFRVENYAYTDSFGRETVTWVRSFQFPDRLRRFDATMIYSDARRRVVDYLGTHQHLAVDIDLAVTAAGGLRLRSGAQRFYAGPLGFRFPMLFSGYADVCEWYDDATRLYRIDVRVYNRVWGNLFGYRGRFDVQYLAVDSVPQNVKPIREERRE